MISDIRKISSTLLTNTIENNRIDFKCMGWSLSVLNCKIMSMISQFYRKSMGMSWQRSTRVSQENISKTMLRQIGLGIIA